MSLPYAFVSQTKFNLGHTKSDTIDIALSHQPSHEMPGMFFSGLWADYVTIATLCDF